MTKRGTIEVTAPGRVDLSAGFPDVQPFCDVTDGTVLNISIGLGVEVTVTPHAVSGSPWVERLIAAAASELGLTPPASLSAELRLPAAAGLGTSGATSVAVVAAIVASSGGAVDRDEVAAAAWRAERAMGNPGGTQDQLASVHGGLGLVESSGTFHRRAQVVANLEELGRRVVVVHRGGARSSGSIVEDVCRHATARSFACVAAMSDIAKRMATDAEQARWTELAEGLTESAQLLEQLDPRIAPPAIVEELQAHGATSAKPCGAGTAAAAWVVLVEPVDADGFKTAATTAGWRAIDTSLGSGGLCVKYR